MLTLFATAKPFQGHVATTQRNAIQSWTLLQPRPQVILLGDDEGTAEVAKELGVEHVAEVERSDYGTPLLNDLFEQAQRLATYDLLCYVNADIILMNDFMTALRQVANQMPRFLMVGRRMDVDVKGPIDFSAGWEDKLRAHIGQHGRLHPPAGIDYFAFRRGMWGDIPRFAIGRPAFDNWLIYRARALGASVVDATDVVKVIHQNHDYSHVPTGAIGVWEGPEAKRNMELTGGRKHIFTLRDATDKLAPSGGGPVLKRKYFFSHLKVIPRLYSKLAYYKDAVRALTIKYSRMLWLLLTKVATSRRSP
ncbi:MAG: hypothetical protein AAB303_01985 [Chloroflexota bacterium]